MFITLSRYGFLLPMILSLPLVAKLALVDPLSLGVDTRTHVYKGYVLAEQIRNLPPVLWGSWDWNWFGGYTFLKLYSPMFYYILAFPSILFNCSPEIVARLVILASFPLSAASMYFLAKQLTKNKAASMIGGTAYAYVPFHITNFTVSGNPSSLVTYVFMPLSLLFAEKFVETSKKHFMILSSLSTLGVFLSNHGYGASYIVVFLAWFVLRRKMIQGLIVVFATALLSTFFLAPLLFYSSSNGNLLIPMRSEADFASSVIAVIWPGGEAIGFTYFILGAMLLTLILLGFIKTERNCKRLYISSLFKRNNLMSICIALIAIICLYNLLTFFFPIQPFSSLTFGRTMPPTLLLLTLLLSLVFGTFKTSKIFVGVIFILLIFEGLMTPIYHPLQPQRYLQAFTFLDGDDEWFRAYFVPPEPEGALIPMYTEKPVIGGWFVQGRNPALHKLLESFDEQLLTNRDRALMVFKYLGTKYIVVESLDPIFGLDYSMTLYQALNASSITEQVFSDGSIKVFRIQDFKPLIASSRVHVIAEAEEIYERISDNEIYVLNNNEFDVTSELQGSEKVNIQIHSINQEVGSYLTSLTVDRSSYLLIPVSYSPNLSVKINSTTVTPLKAVPNFICVKLPEAGTYSIEISLDATSIDLLAYSISSVSLLFLLLSMYKRPSSQPQKESASDDKKLILAKNLEHSQTKIISTNHHGMKPYPE